MTAEYSVILIVLFVIYVMAATAQLFFYLHYYLEVHRYKAEAGKYMPSVSVIICARNEAENIEKFLPSVLSQDYPDYEVILVNDCSEDNSYDVLGDLLVRYPHLKVSTITRDPKFTHNKRFAQFIGIKAASKEILLFTDADCQPVSDTWLRSMVSHFDEKTDFVLGYGGYFKSSSLLGKYITYDTMVIAMQYLGMALKGKPYMGVGRNLAYRRSLFFDNKGFGTHNHLISGDDDLFVNSHATSTNTKVEYSAGAHTRSVPAQKLQEWITQKKRHMTTAPFYKASDKAILVAEPASRVIFYALTAVLLAFSFIWPAVVALFVVRLAAEITIFALVQKRLDEKGMAGWAALFDVVSPFINGFIFLASIVRKPGNNRWK